MGIGLLAKLNILEVAILESLISYGALLHIETIAIRFVQLPTGLFISPKKVHSKKPQAALVIDKI